MRIPVSVVVVSYNTKVLLSRCLRSLDDVAEVIVIDNASQDGSAEMVRREFPGAIVIENSANRGFGAANNQGLDRSTFDVVLLLNSDAYAEPGAVQRLFDRFADQSLIAAGGRLVSPDGGTQNSCADRLTLWRVLCEQLLLDRIFPTSQLFNGYWQTRWLPPGRDSDVHQVMGACLMMRKQLRFDERIKLYCEDTELCVRLRDLGRILYVPEAVFGHELGASSAKRRAWSIAMYNRGKEQYFLFHFGLLHASIAWFLNRIGALFRMLVWTVVFIATVGSKGKGQPTLFLRVLVSPIQGPRLDSIAQ